MAPTDPLREFLQRQAADQAARLDALLSAQQQASHQLRLLQDSHQALAQRVASAEPTAEILARLHTVEMAAATPQRIASTEPSAAILDRLHAVEAAAAAARDSADAAVRQVNVLPATPVAATSRRDTIMGVAHDRRRRRRSLLPAVTGEASTTRCRVAQEEEEVEEEEEESNLINLKIN